MTLWYNYDYFCIKFKFLNGSRFFLLVLLCHCWYKTDVALAANLPPAEFSPQQCDQSRLPGVEVSTLCYSSSCLGDDVTINKYIIHTHTHTHTLSHMHTYTHTCTHTYTHTHTHKGWDTQKGTHTHTHTYTHTHTHTPACMHVHTHTHMHAHTQWRIHVRAHAHTHTHTHKHTGKCYHKLVI